MASLSKMLKAAGVDAKEFKKYIGVETSVNSSALQQLYSVGDITKQQLKGCYTAKIVKSIRISERKGGTD
jgi:predicted transcriptional regulator